MFFVYTPQFFVVSLILAIFLLCSLSNILRKNCLDCECYRCCVFTSELVIVDDDELLRHERGDVYASGACEVRDVVLHI